MHEIAVLIEAYGLGVVFLAMLLDQAGVPIPAFPVVMVAAALASQGSARVSVIVLAGVAGGLISDFAWYSASRRHGRRLLGLLCKISLSPDSCVRQTETLYARVGGLSLIFARWFPGFGLVSTVLAGTSGIALPQFLALDFLGECLFVGVAAFLGAFFKTAIFVVIATLTNLGSLGVAVAAGALALYVFARWWQRRSFVRQLQNDRISVDELGRMIDGGETPVILDVRPHAVRQQEGIIPGALFAHPADAEFSLAAFPRDVEVVIYCSCPNEASAALAAQHLRRVGFAKIRPLQGGLQAWTQAGRPIAPVEEREVLASAA